MVRIPIRDENRRPSRLFDLLFDENGRIYVEIKFKDWKQPSRVRIDHYINKEKRNQE